MDKYENCWLNGVYNSECSCDNCPHKFECSGSDCSEGDDE